MERAGDALVATIGSAAVGDADSPADALRAGLHAFFAFLDADRAAWARPLRRDAARTAARSPTGSPSTAGG